MGGSRGPFAEPVRRGRSGPLDAEIGGLREQDGGRFLLGVKLDAALIQIVTWVMGRTDGLLYEPLVI